MDDSILTAFTEWTKGCEPVAARIALFEHVRDIPYQFSASRDPVEVLKTGRGSASGKHYLLGELLRHLGLKVRHMLCTHRFNESPLPFPDDMQEMLRKNEIVDVHDYLQIFVDDQWIDIDVTWEAGLHDFGFPVNEEWDGKTSMLLTVIPDEQIKVEGDPAKAKEDQLAKLTHRQRQLRKQFLEALGRLVDEMATEIPRDP
jgi:hypothetical protein